ncbi:hypothetical protein M9H77_07478 [Catharanthus roseus]|uniref:Uncharacterized protein n=1 Tax=Catharanthus roseus TaxID=4058 RepID=A0ACC0BVF2_CATRO|nr:hypothetical protein M9H77_07478 [Catharanthus roseus]
MKDSSGQTFSPSPSRHSGNSSAAYISKNLQNPPKFIIWRANLKFNHRSSFPPSGCPQYTLHAPPPTSSVPSTPHPSLDPTTSLQPHTSSRTILTSMPFLLPSRLH